MPIYVNMVRDPVGLFSLVASPRDPSRSAPRVGSRRSGRTAHTGVGEATSLNSLNSRSLGGELAKKLLNQTA